YILCTAHTVPQACQASNAPEVGGKLCYLRDLLKAEVTIVGGEGRAAYQPEGRTDLSLQMFHQCPADPLPLPLWSYYQRSQFHDARSVRLVLDAADDVPGRVHSNCKASPV